MALLAAYRLNRGPEERLEDYLAQKVFAGTTGATIRPDPAVVEGFNAYIRRFQALLEVERTAVPVL